MTIYKKAIISMCVHILSLVIAIQYSNPIATLIASFSTLAYVYSIQAIDLATKDKKIVLRVFLLTLPIFLLIFIEVPIVATKIFFPLK